MGWSKQELQEECTRRGLKTTGSNDALVERLENNESAVKAAVSHKRKAVSRVLSGRAATPSVQARPVGGCAGCVVERCQHQLRE
jgi:hypothetical protein